MGFGLFELNNVGEQSAILHTKATQISSVAKVSIVILLDIVCVRPIVDYGHHQDPQSWTEPKQAFYAFTVGNPASFMHFFTKTSAAAAVNSAEQPRGRWVVPQSRGGFNACHEFPRLQYRSAKSQKWHVMLPLKAVLLSGINQLLLLGL